MAICAICGKVIPFVSGREDYVGFCQFHEFIEIT